MRRHRISQPDSRRGRPDPVRRRFAGDSCGIEPHRGRMELPGGYIEAGETWQQAACREVREETGLILDEAELRTHSVASGDDATLLIFALAEPRSTDMLNECRKTSEADDACVLTNPDELAFPLHRGAARAYFLERSSITS
ncbi:MAG: NUDIX domain-containing protein [Pirellulales bacterium]